VFVSRIFTSWNQLDGWLRQVEGIAARGVNPCRVVRPGVVGLPNVEEAHGRHALGQFGDIRLNSSVRSNRSAIFLLNPRAPLIVCLPSIRFPGKTIMPPIV
jgi:hypothetical protein